MIDTYKEWIAETICDAATVLYEEEEQPAFLYEGNTSAGLSFASKQQSIEFEIDWASVDGPLGYYLIMNWIKRLGLEWTIDRSKSLITSTQTNVWSLIAPPQIFSCEEVGDTDERWARLFCIAHAIEAGLIKRCEWEEEEGE